MRFAERAVVFVLRPIYRTFFERLLWWFLVRIKTFFFAETSVQLENIERRLRVLEESLAPSERAEAANAAQWDALEQLLLALFRQPEQWPSDPDSSASTPQNTAISTTADLNRVHAAVDIR